jgi:hypothetical protein
MSRYKTVTVDAEVDLSDFDTDDLIEELEDRGKWPGSSDIRFDSTELLETIWKKRRLGNHDYQQELDRLIYAVLGKVV